MSDNTSVIPKSKLKHIESSSCDINATIVPTSDLGRSDQVVTPTSLEQDDSYSPYSLKRKAFSRDIAIGTPLKKMKKVKEEKHYDENPAANSIEQRNKLDESETLSGISEYLRSRNIVVEEESTKGYKELEVVKSSAQAHIDRLKALHTFQKIDNFDWSKIEEAYAFIFNDYITLMEHIIRDLDQSMKERRAWQEIVFTLDRERSADRINKSERWITAKEMNFNNVKLELENSVKLIQKEFLKFDTPKNYKKYSTFEYQ